MSEMKTISKYIITVWELESSHGGGSDYSKKEKRTVKDAAERDLVIKKLNQKYKQPEFRIECTTVEL